MSIVVLEGSLTDDEYSVVVVADSADDRKQCLDLAKQKCDAAGEGSGFSRKRKRPKEFKSTTASIMLDTGDVLHLWQQGKCAFRFLFPVKRARAPEKA